MFRKIRCDHCLSLETSLGVSFLGTNVLFRCLDCQKSEVIFYGDSEFECSAFIERVFAIRKRQPSYKWRPLQSTVPQLQKAWFVRNYAPGRFKLFALSRVRLRRGVRSESKQLNLF